MGPVYMVCGQLSPTEGSAWDLRVPPALAQPMEAVSAEPRQMHLPEMAPNGARRIFVPTNPGLVNILGRTDLNFENFVFFDFLDPTFLDFQVPQFWISQKSGFPKKLMVHLSDFLPRQPPTRAP